MTFNEVWNEILSEMPRKQRIRIRILSFVEYCKVHLLHISRKIRKR